MKIDLHTHTIASIHGFSTVKEMADEAKNKGIEVLGITDHGPAAKDSPSLSYFWLGQRIPKYINGVRILFGVEANILDDTGTLDIPDNILERLDIVIAGLHLVDGYKNGGRESNTRAIVNAMKNPYVKMISHPYSVSSKVDVDIEKIAKKACELDVLLEVNSAYFYANTNKDLERTYEYMRRMITILKENNKKTIVSSDAHIAYDIARDDELREKFDYLGLSDDILLNDDVEEVLKFFNIS